MWQFSGLTTVVIFITHQCGKWRFFLAKISSFGSIFCANGWAKVPNATVRWCVDKTSGDSTKGFHTYLETRKPSLYKKGQVVRTIRHLIIHDASQFWSHKMKKYLDLWKYVNPKKSEALIIDTTNQLHTANSAITSICVNDVEQRDGL